MKRIKVFVSHSAKDKDHLKDLRGLKRQGVDLWVDEENLLTGDLIAERLKEGIVECSICLFLQTNHSLKSTWCHAEVAGFWAAGKPVIIWILDPGTDKTSHLPFLVGVKTAKTIFDVTKALNALQAKTDTPKDLFWGQLSKTEGITAIVDGISSSIAPLQQAVAGIYDRLSALAPFDENSLFGQRFRHFFDEKRAIARVFLNNLEQLIVNANQGKRRNHSFRLLLDSGTTVFPIFSMLMDRKYNRLLTESLEIITNNLSGLAIMMRDGRLNDGDPYSRLAYKVLAVSGEPLPAFWAVLPENPEEVLRRVVERPSRSKEGSTTTIAVTTSNYLRDDGKCLFVRTAAHSAFKKALMDRADIIYLLFPLGKMLNTTSKEMNKKIVSSQERNNEDHMYRDLAIPFASKRKIIFVTTRRTAEDCLYRHFVTIEAHLTALQKKCKNSGCDVEIIFLEAEDFNMTKLSRGEPVKQEELEMPHKNHRPHLREWLRWGVR